jgi:ABC-type branched-subunit amino acid transport system permease subunit
MPRLLGLTTLLLAALLIIILVIRPEGIMGDREFNFSKIKARLMGDRAQK